MKPVLTLIVLLLSLTSCKGQSEPERTVGGRCQDCVALLDYKMLNVTLASTVTLPGYQDYGPKLKITGTVFQNDGKTPASDVILYIYHVDRTGRYTPSANPKGWEERHGQFRSWLKTGKDGSYTFYTFRPVSYPNSQIPEHIHLYVKEPNTIPYYIDSIEFESDPLLTTEKKQAAKNRGGSGIVQLQKENDIYTAHRNIILGLNIPEYD